MPTTIWLVGRSASDAYMEIYGIEVQSAWLSEHDANVEADRVANLAYDAAVAKGMPVADRGWAWFREEIAVHSYPIGVACSFTIP